MYDGDKRQLGLGGGVWRCVSERAGRLCKEPGGAGWVISSM